MNPIRVDEQGNLQVELSIEAQAQAAANRLASETARLNGELAQKDALIQMLVERIKVLEEEASKRGDLHLRKVVDSPQA